MYEYHRFDNHINFRLPTKPSAGHWYRQRDYHRFGSVGGMGASWAFAAMAVKMFGKEAEETIAIFCLLFASFFMVVIWEAEIGEYTVLS
jgi:hypothetical protein